MLGAEAQPTLDEALVLGAAGRHELQSVAEAPHALAADLEPEPDQGRKLPAVLAELTRADAADDAVPDEDVSGDGLDHCQLQAVVGAAGADRVDALEVELNDAVDHGVSSVGWCGSLVSLSAPAAASR